MDRYERRRQRLRLLIDEQCGGKISECARLLDKPQSYVGRLLYPAGKKGKRNIGDGLIKALEDTFSLPPGWLDGAEQDAALVDICKRWDALPNYKQLSIYSLFVAIANAPAVDIDTTTARLAVTRKLLEENQNDTLTAPEKKPNSWAAVAQSIRHAPRKSSAPKIYAHGEWRDYHGNFERENRSKSRPVLVDHRQQLTGV